MIREIALNIAALASLAAFVGALLTWADLLGGLI